MSTFIKNHALSLVLATGWVNLRPAEIVFAIGAALRLCDLRRSPPRRRSSQ